jgi:hypothetical protein
VDLTSEGEQSWDGGRRSLRRASRKTEVGSDGVFIPDSRHSRIRIPILARTPFIRGRHMALHLDCFLPPAGIVPNECGL